MAELVWDGKYDKDGRRPAPLRVALPFQTVETVNESAQDYRQPDGGHVLLREITQKEIILVGGKTTIVH